MPLSSRLGVVYVPRRCVPPCAAFRTWLDGPVLGELLDDIGVSRANNIRARLSELAQKLMWPTLAYMAGRGDAVFREEVVTLQVGKAQDRIFSGQTCTAKRRLGVCEGGRLVACPFAHPDT